MAKNKKAKLIKFELNEEGVKELLKSQGVAQEVARHAEEKARECGKGYASALHEGKNRAYANIYPATKEAAHDNFINNTLEKVIRK